MGSTTNTNVVVVSGNLVKDAELKDISPDFSVLNFTVAVNESVKKADSWDSYANFFDISLSGKRAKAIAKYLTKGKKVLVAGTLHQDRWEKDGHKQSRIVIRADSVEFCGGSNSEGNSDSAQSSGESGFSDEVPF